MRIRFVGSGDAFGSGGRFQACVAVEAARGLVLLDCGASSLVAMRRLGVDPATVDAVVLSHLHGDHFGGLPFLILDGQFRRRTRPLTVAGPPGVETRVREAMEVLFPGSSRIERAFAVEFRELRDREPEAVGPVSVTAYPVVHPSGAPALALRVEGDGKVVAYSGDTEWAESLVDVARGADLFICEAYSFDKRVKYHLDYATLVRHRDRLACRRLVLTHMSAEMLARLGEVDVAHADDGMVVDV